MFLMLRVQFTIRGKQFIFITGIYTGEKIDLSNGTITAFRRLFEKILNGFNVPSEAEEDLEKEEEPAEKTPEPQVKRRRLFRFIKQK